MSILGPTLFIFVINDICNVSNLVKFILFADYTNVFCAGDNQLERECMLNRKLAKLCKWFAVNQLSLNLSKTSCRVYAVHEPGDRSMNSIQLVCILPGIISLVRRARVEAAFALILSISASKDRLSVKMWFRNDYVP